MDIGRVIPSSLVEHPPAGLPGELEPAGPRHWPVELDLPLTYFFYERMLNSNRILPKLRLDYDYAENLSDHFLLFDSFDCFEHRQIYVRDLDDLLACPRLVASSCPTLGAEIAFALIIVSAVFRVGLALLADTRKAQGAGLASLQEKRLTGIHFTNWDIAFVSCLSPVANFDETPSSIRVFLARVAAVVVAIQPSITATPVHVNVV
ncbi:hypothetical protein THAOC_34747 [Thalassiosira oceanica]|uniref:Uncharacterized protein n=1 Tax=Thalassiosira oceanica TaxID=159749 RepID=K0R4I3_THAOC|nr:hypothetical protein THAOC_34747 [Thalassiosira oceanica]|eukprot:EJK46579.1 hypothetical protein THAOC_34747 [Thalassiosira oceanica]